jgi:hypothetical protein
MELTKEYFDKTLDQKLKNVSTKQDLDEKLAHYPTKEDLDQKFDEKLKNVVTKDYLDTRLDAKLKDYPTKNELDEKLELALNSQTQQLKAYIHEGFEINQGYIDERFVELMEYYDVRERVHAIELDIEKLKQR